MLNENDRLKLKKQLDKNDPVCNLTHIDLNEQSLEYILKKLKQKPNIGLIKRQSKQLSTSIELEINKELKSHNLNYEQFASDYIHCLLCSHCLEPDLKFEAKYNQLTVTKWKLKTINENKLFKSVLYYNYYTKQMVIAFRGFIFKQNDFFKTNLIDLQTLNSNQDLKQEITNLLEHIIDLCSQLKYNLSFTGHGFAAWLAQLSLEISINDFRFNNVKAVLFDSPGCLAKLTTTFNLVTYLTAPNFINTFSEQSGTIYRVFTQKSDFILNANQYDFCSNGLYILYSNWLDLILAEFDPNSGKCYNCELISEWPKFIFKKQKKLDLDQLFNDLNFIYGLIDKKVIEFPSYDLNEYENKDLIKVSNDIKFDPNYKFKEFNLNKDILVNKQEDHIDKILFNLYNYPNRLTSISDELIREQLITLRQSFKLNDFKIESTIPIETIKTRLKRLIQIDPTSVFKLKINLLDLNGLQPKLDLYFTARTYELDKLKELFQLNQYVYITGKSGVGKTSLARQYCELANRTHSIIWIQSNLLYKTFIEMAQQFNIFINYKQNVTDYSAKLFQKIKIELNNFSAVNQLNILFIIDDLVYIKEDNYLNDFKHLTNGFSSNIKFLITTLIDHEANSIKLDVFNNKECLDFIAKTNLNTKLNDFNLIELVKSFKPVDLNKFMSKVNQNKQWSLKHLKIYLGNESEHYYYLVQQENRKAFDILSFFAYLDSSQISFTFIKQLTEQKTKQLKSNLEYLVHNSEINQNDQCYSINKICQIEILKIFLMKENKEIQLLNRIVDCLNEPDLNNELLQHAIKILKIEWKNKTTNKNLIGLQFKVAKVYKNDLLKHQIALDYYKNLLKCDLNQVDSALVNILIGEIFYEQNDPKLALNYFEQSLKIQIKTIDTNKQQLALTYFKIGLAYDDLNEFTKSIHYYEKALNNSTNQHEIYNNIGLIYTNLYETTKGLEYLNKSLQLSESSNCLNNIGGVYYNNGDHMTALDYFNKALQIQLETLPSNHSDIALSYNNIAGCYENMLNSSQALTLLHKALQIEQDYLNHLNMATCFVNLAGVYLTLIGDYDKALDYNEKALIIRKELLTLNHPDIGVCLNNIAGCYLKLNCNEIAFEYLEQCEKIVSRSVIKTPDMAITFNNLSFLYLKTNDFDKAFEFSTKAIDIFKNKSLLDHPLIAVFYSNIGLVCKMRNDCDKSLEYYKKALVIFKTLLNQQNIALVTNNIGCVYVVRKEYKKAVDLFESSLAISRIYFDYNHLNISLIYYNIVDTYDLINSEKKGENSKDNI